MNGSDAVGESFQQCPSPAARGEGGGLLIGLLVRLGKESHSLLVHRRVFAYGDYEINVAVGLVLLDREVVEAGQLLGRISLRKRPFANLASFLRPVARGRVPAASSTPQRC